MQEDGTKDVMEVYKAKELNRKKIETLRIHAIAKLLEDITSLERSCAHKVESLEEKITSLTKEKDMQHLEAIVNKGKDPYC